MSVDASSNQDAAFTDGAFAPEASSHCECDNLDVCCAQAAQTDNGVACRAKVAGADESACRASILQGNYGCLALGFTPHCSGADDALCPSVSSACSLCLTSYRNCGPAIECVQNPACKPAWDAMVACDMRGRPFSECFNLLQQGTAPGELILYGAQCVETCQRDP
jgi:hypothetical protein